MYNVLPWSTWEALKSQNIDEYQQRWKATNQNHEINPTAIYRQMNSIKSKNEQQQNKLKQNFGKTFPETKGTGSLDQQ